MNLIYFALVGDIGYVKDDGFFHFLRKQLKEFRIVFLVLGNHEPYYSSWFETESEIKRFEMDLVSIQSGEPPGQLSPDLLVRARPICPIERCPDHRSRRVESCVGDHFPRAGLLTMPGHSFTQALFVFCGRLVSLASRCV